MRGNRQPPVGSGAVNVMLFSDVHTEDPPHPQQHYSYKALDDLNAMAGRHVIDAWGCGGDITSRASESEYAKAIDWLSGLNRGGAPLAIVPGKHDLIGTGGNASGDPDIVTPAQWATKLAAFGVTGRDYVVDVGDALRILCVSPMNNDMSSLVKTRRLAIDEPTLAWCDARMSETTRRCMIIFHAPLQGSVGTDGAPYSSNDPNWYAHSNGSRTIEQMIAGHSNFIAWASGHTHSPPQTDHVVRRMQYGSATFAAISIGSPLILPMGTKPAMTSSLLSVYPDRIEVRHRDHGARQWLAPVQTVAF